MVWVRARVQAIGVDRNMLCVCIAIGIVLAKVQVEG